MYNLNRIHRYWTEGQDSGNTRIEYRFDKKVCNTCMIVDMLIKALWKERLRKAVFMQSRGCLNTYLQDRRNDSAMGRKINPSVYDRKYYLGFNPIIEWNRRWKRVEERIRVYLANLY